MFLCESLLSFLPSGVGQSEFAVADMVDMFVLLIPPAGGDELQVSAQQKQQHSSSTQMFSSSKLRNINTSACLLWIKIKLLLINISKIAWIVPVI